MTYTSCVLLKQKITKKRYNYEMQREAKRRRMRKRRTDGKKKLDIFERNIKR